MSAVDFADAQLTFSQGRYVDTLHILNRLLGQVADGPAMHLLGNTFIQLGMSLEAADVFSQAADLDDGEKHIFLKKAALLYFKAGNMRKAELHGLRLRQTHPDDVDIVFMLITIFMKQKNRGLIDHLKYQLIASDHPVHLDLAHELIGADFADERVLELFRKLRKLHPDDMQIRADLIAFAREYADYDVLDAEDAVFGGAVPPAQVIAFEAPMDNLLWCGNEAVNRLALNAPVSVPFRVELQEKRRNAPHVWGWGRKIRIGYLSTDFRPDHVVMRQLRDVLKRHDRARFDICLISCTQQTGFNARKLLAPLGYQVDIAGLTDAKAAKEIRHHKLDILVDLSGHTGNSRASLLNFGLAPLQVSWLGFPGSTVGIDSDYIIGDATVLPESAAPHYDEKICRLPETFMPNDPMLRPLPVDQDRKALGLPEDKFIFASFNAPKKITPRVMALWAKILIGAPDAVLWINARGKTAETNIAERFARLGVDPARLIFAEPIRDYDAHIARMRAADLGLDTFPYNGHATTSDKLWVGLPVVTRKGSNFASRVTESQLRMLGIEDLVADCDDDYCALAIALAKDPVRARTYRDALDERRATAPLFDSERFCRHLEVAFGTMVARAKDGLPPEAFDVPAMPPREVPFLRSLKGYHGKLNCPAVNEDC